MATIPTPAPFRQSIRVAIQRQRVGVPAPLPRRRASERGADGLPGGNRRRLPAETPRPRLSHPCRSPSHPRRCPESGVQRPASAVVFRRQGRSAALRNRLYTRIGENTDQFEKMIRVNPFHPCQSVYFCCSVRSPPYRPARARSDAVLSVTARLFFQPTGPQTGPRDSPGGCHRQSYLASFRIAKRGYQSPLQRQRRRGYFPDRPNADSERHFRPRPGRHCFSYGRLRQGRRPDRWAENRSGNVQSAAPPTCQVLCRAKSARAHSPGCGAEFAVRQPRPAPPNRPRAARWVGCGPENSRRSRPIGLLPRRCRCRWVRRKDCRWSPLPEIPTGPGAGGAGVCRAGRRPGSGCWARRPG